MPNATTKNNLSKPKMTNPSTPPLSKMWEIAFPTPLRIDAPGSKGSAPYGKLHLSVCCDSADRCFPLPYVANATPSTTDADYWTTSVLRCYRGHRFFVGESELDWMTMTCQSNGWWSPILTACKRECIPIILYYAI